jgi:hypothetical protein
MLDRVEDVVVRNAVSSGGRVNLHTRLMYYRNRGDQPSRAGRPP